MRGLRLRVRNAGVLPGGLAGEGGQPGRIDGRQENGRFGGGVGSMPITRPPASIALPGRSITQLTVLPVALAAPPTIDDSAENMPPRGGATGVAGGGVAGWTGAAATGPTGAVATAGAPGVAGATGATCSGAF